MPEFSSDGAAKIEKLPRKAISDLARATEGHIDDHFNVNPASVIESLSRIPADNLKLFVQKTSALYESIKSHNVDFLIEPWRGIVPVRWILEEYAEHRGEEFPETVWLPLGTGYDIDTVLQSGLGQEHIGDGVILDKSSIKKLSIQEVIKTLLDLGYEDRLQNGTVMLIDEVQSGSTFTEAMLLLQEVLNENALDTELIGSAILDYNVKDSRTRVPQYLHLVAGNVGSEAKYKQLLQATRQRGTDADVRQRLDRIGGEKMMVDQYISPFSTIDMIPMLPMILRKDSEGTNYRKHELQEPYPNPAAEYLLKKISREIIETGESLTHLKIIENPQRMIDSVKELYPDYDLR